MMPVPAAISKMVRVSEAALRPLARSPKIADEHGTQGADHEARAEDEKSLEQPCVGSCRRGKEISGDG